MLLTQIILKKYFTGPLENARDTQIYSKLKIIVCSNTSDFPKAEVAYINALLKQTDPKNATGPDIIPSKLVKMSANVIDKHLCNIINMDINN